VRKEEKRRRKGEEERDFLCVGAVSVDKIARK
jgi:hypothetical protein